MIYAWSIIIALSLIVEFNTEALVSVWFSVGAFVALLMAIMGASETWQIVVFILLSLAMVLIIKLVLQKYLKKNDEKTNVHEFIGKELKLLTATEEGKGTVKISGVIWTAISKEVISEGTKVRIIKIDGNKLVVEEVETK